MNSGRSAGRGNAKFIRLFEPFNMGKISLKNRIVFPAITTNLSHRDGRPSSRLQDHFVARAKGGAGLIIVEPACVDYPRGQGMVNELDISTDRAIADLGGIARAVKEAGSRVALQLHHAGGFRRLADTIDVPPVAPSRLYHRYFDTPDELDTAQIRELVSMYAEGASRAKAAGFDAVEFHGAHGFLICQFLSSLTNRRKDGYGGDLSNRMRFFQEIVACTRHHVGKEFPLICRLSAEEYVEGGLTLEESQVIVRGLEEAGADAIHVSVSSTPDNSRREVVFNVPPMGQAEGRWVHLAEAIRKSCSLPVIAVGRIHSPRLAEEILAEGKADLVAVGRALLADPEWPNKVRDGRLEEIRPCIACNVCLHRVVREKLDVACSVNAALGREEVSALRTTPRRKRILVLGGGPGGMEAALTAAKKGHEVHLWERGQVLGGQLLAASAPPGKEPIAAWAAHLVGRIAKTEVRVRLGVEWTVEDVLRLLPEAVVVATGARYEKPSIPGCEGSNVVTVRQVLERQVDPGARILIVGGGAVGLETADFLACEDRKITLVEQFSSLAPDMEPFRRRFVMGRLKEAGVILLVDRRLCEVTNEGGKVVDREGKISEIAADTVVMATGAKPERDALVLLGETVPDIYLVGDARKPRRIFDAILEGRMVGYRI